MKLQIERIGVAAVAMLVIALCASGAQAQGKSGDKIPDQYIVVLKSEVQTRGASKKEVNERALGLLKRHGGQEADLKRVFGNSVRGFTAKIPAGQLKKLEADPEVAYIEADRIITLSPPDGKGRGKKKREEPPPPPPAEGTQQTPWGVTRVGGPVSGAGKTIWVIDTGVDLDHPDLKVDLARSKSFIASGSDANSADDGNGHGTHVSGTVAALDNGIGVVGVAAGATVVGVKVLDSQGSGSYSSVIGGVDYVAETAAAGDAANMSLGGPTSQALDDAIRAAAAKGILFALAAGNEAQNANNTSPARVEAENVFTVSAIDSADNFASFSNFSGPGEPPVELAAPGVGILSTWPGGQYNSISGTSMASPHVAGLLLLHGTTVATDGNVKSGDPDGDPDPIAHH